MIVLSANVVSPESTRATPQTPSGKPDDPRLALRQTRFGLDPPKIMSQTDLERFSALLTLSDAQSQYAKIFLDQYQDECKRLDGEFIPKLIIAAQPIVDGQGDPNARLSIYRHLINVRELELDHEAAIADEDDRFMSRLATLVAEVQAPHLARVRLYWQRSRAKKEQNDLLKARIDLEQLVRQLCGESDSATDADLILREYEEKATPLFVEADSIRKKSLTTLTELNIRMEWDDRGMPLDRESPQNVMRILTASQERAALLARRAASQEKIGSANDDFLPLIIDKLPKEIGAQVRVQFLNRVYPRVYPDVNDPAELFRFATDSPSVTDETRDVLRAKWQKYRQVYDNLCQKMSQESDRWQSQIVGRRSLDGWQEHNALMDKLALQRMKASEECVSDLTSLFQGVANVEIGDRVQQWKAHLKTQRDNLIANPRNYASHD